MSPRRETNKPVANRRKFIAKEEDDSCDIKIYEPKNKRPEIGAKSSKHTNNEQLRVKDLVDDDEDVLGDDDEQDEMDDDDHQNHRRQAMGRDKFSDMDDDQQ